MSNPAKPPRGIAEKTTPRQRRAALMAGRKAGAVAADALVRLAALLKREGPGPGVIVYDGDPDEIGRFVGLDRSRVTRDAAEPPPASAAPQASRQVRRAAERLKAKGKR